MLKRIGLAVLFCMMFCLFAQADSEWKNSFALGQSEEWYGSEEAKRIAENVLLYQRHSGGWPKNIEMHHELTESEKQQVVKEKGDLSCFDNGATTTEMRFLAKVYRHIPDSRYVEAFNSGLDCILQAQSICGSGWPQYYPRRGGDAGSSYSNFITFNDNIVVNILKMLRDVFTDGGEFADITTIDTRRIAQESYDKGLQCILDCQIRNDQGQLTVWCAQHDPETLLPAVARNYEMPSYSGGESVGILRFLMSIKEPSQEIKDAIKAGVRWFDENAIEDKATEKFINANGENDVRMIDAPGKRLWPRFTQIEGEIGHRTYEALFQYLEKYGSTRTYTINGKTVRYRDVDNARNSYDPTKGGQPIYCPKSSDAGCSYRFAYNFNDTPPVTDENGVQLPTSLNTYDRTTYSFASEFADKLFSEYNKWKQLYIDSTVVYSVAHGESIPAGTTITRSNITLTYGEQGGADFYESIECLLDETFNFYTPGNGVNGNKAGGTFYTFQPQLNGLLTMAVKHNLPKPLYIEEDGVALPGYNGISFDDTHPSQYCITINVKAGSAYKLYCSGSKLGFFGFMYDWRKTSDITDITTPKQKIKEGVYDINGKRLSAPRKGANIINGKKVIY